MSISNLYPTIAPSLNLDFANVKALDPRISFVRTTTATYYGTETAKAEENLLLQSQFASGWLNSGTNTITANNDTAPDGTSTAALVSSPASADYVYQVSTIVVGQVYTTSVFVKNTTGGNAATISLLFVRNTSNNAQVSINWTGSTLSSVTLTDGTAADFVSVGNDWYRVRVTFTALEASPRFRIYGGDLLSTTGDIFAWGAQLEQRSAVTAYTPTTTQPITNYIPVLETAASGVARFDHNPTTFESLGLLVEEQRTNLALRSEEFDNASWTKTRSSITANTIVAPDGTLTGDKLVEDTTASNTHQTDQSITLVASTTYALSLYAKAGERTRIRIAGRIFASWSSFPEAIFDLSAGTVVSGTGTITSVGNGWYRCSVIGTASGTNAGILVGLVSTGTTFSYTGDGYSGIYIWGAQLEAGAFPTSYIATTSASVTRNADAASMTGTNFSSFFNAGEFTIYSEFRRDTTANAATGGGASVPRIYAIGTASTGLFQLRLFASTGAEVTGPSLFMGSTWAASQYNKHAVAYKVNDAAVVRDGGTAVTDTTVDPFTTTNDRISFGQNTPGTGNIGQGWIRKLAFYPARIPDAQLQALTS